MAMAEQGEPAGRQPIAPAKRRMLQQCFEHGNRSMAQGQFDYATTMLTQCVTGDPGNVLYVQSFLGNLQKKYNNNKTGGKLSGIRGAGIKTSLKNSVRKKDWLGVITSGLEMLKLNPWDTSALADMAAACEHLQFDEAQLAYLKGALDADIKDPEINRLCGRALARQGQFDQAIACWIRVQQAKPNDEEAQRAIGNLTVEKTIHHGGYETAESSTEVMADKQAQADRRGGASSRLTPEQQLEKQIAKDPSDLAKYLELTELHLKDERFDEAEKVLERALSASGGSVEVRERLEDVQLRRARGQLAIAEKKAQAEKTPESAALYQQMRAELNNKELEIYRNRCDRYPTNLGFKFELGVRLQRAKNYKEAIKVFQEAHGDLKRKGLVSLSLGYCFEQIAQHKLAMSNYEAAAAELRDRDADQQKMALYRAAALAMDRLKDWPAAEKNLTELAGLDFGYKDVSERLDKLAQLREDGAGSSSP
ncbi:MAG: tetratricopeptide repeat protein [Pirellulales bacterium]